MPVHLLSMAALAHRAKNIYNPALFQKFANSVLSSTVATKHTVPLNLK